MSQETRITVPILRLLHARPYLSVPEVARALGFSHQACGVALGRLSAAGDVVDRLEGRVIVKPNGVEQVRRLRCYAIAPIKVDETPPAVDVPTSRDKELGCIRRNGGGLSAKEIATYCRMKPPAIARILDLLVEEGKIVREMDERTVRGNRGQSQRRQIYIYSINTEAV